MTSGQAPMQAPTGPAIFVCGACRRLLDDVGVGRYMRCMHCGRTLRVPSRVELRCGQCKETALVPPSQLKVDRPCSRCGTMLPVGEVVMLPRRRRSSHGSRSRHRHVSSHADAALAVLIVGIALLLALLTLTVF